MADDAYSLRERARSLLYRREGDIAVCRACDRVHEGTASFAIQHQQRCWAAQLLACVYEAVWPLDRTEALANEGLPGLPAPEPIPMLLWCPECQGRHVDVGEYETKPHHTHACQQCGHVWRPALVSTVGVQFLPGFKDP